jgi:hypothetical protein
MAAVRSMKISRTGGHCHDAKNGHMGRVKKFTIVESQIKGVWSQTSMEVDKINLASTFCSYKMEGWKVKLKLTGLIQYSIERVSMNDDGGGMKSNQYNCGRGPFQGNILYKWQVLQGNHYDTKQFNLLAPEFGI